MTLQQLSHLAALRKVIIPVSLAFAGTLFCASVNAAYTGTLTFLQPTGTVGPTDDIPVWVRFALDSGSDPLVLNQDASDTPPFGIPLANYPANPYQSGSPEIPDLFDITLTTPTSVYLNTWFQCGTSFTSSGCTTGTPYNFSFNTSGPDSINFLPNVDPFVFTLNPGEHRDYLFGTFSPSAGPVAAGEYTFVGTGLTLNFQGIGTGSRLILDANGNPVPLMAQIFDEYGDPVLDENGDPVFEPVLDQEGNPVFEHEVLEISVSGEYDLANTRDQAPFVRTVTAVPAPAALWLFGSGLGVLVLSRRKK